MWDPVVVGVLCNRLNIKLVIQPNQKLKEFSLEISQKIKNEGLNYPKTIVFCRNYKDCTGLYLSLVEKLRGSQAQLSSCNSNRCSLKLLIQEESGKIQLE